MSRAARRARRRPDREPDFTLEIPPEWKTADWKLVEPSHTLTLPNGGTALMVSAMLKDGTNLFVVTWAGGQRALRVSPVTDWAIEERFTGKPPDGGAAVIARVWRIVVDAAINAAKAAEREFGGRP